MKRGILAAALLALCALLGGCSRLPAALRPDASTPSAPALELLQNEPYTEEAAPASAAPAADYYRVDLWLDGTQNMGGVNPAEESMYPHSTRKYREGGFHYRLGRQTGWYESVLRDLLGAAEGRRVRVLRYGNERIASLEKAGLADTPSVRRDLMTYALDPDATLFAAMSAEDMEGSFYSLGTPLMNQVAACADGLENPADAGLMSAALERQIAAIAAGDRTDTVQPGRTESECALLYALQCVDATRLTVMTADPASIARLSGAEDDGSPAAFYERALRPLFDQGCAVGLYAFKLDYMGQLATVGAARLSEPLIWGKPLYNERKKTIEGVGAMPRWALALVIGPRAQVDDYMARLNDRLNGDTSLRGLRGPGDGELTYAANGQTVTQQPFGFEYRTAVLERPDFGFYTQHRQGASLAVSDGAVETRAGLPTALLSPVGGAQPDRTLTVRVPLAAAPEGAGVDLTKLDEASLSLVSTLLLRETRPNTGESAVAGDEQAIAYRDTLYVYARDDSPAESPFTLASAGRVGDELVLTIAADGSRLTQGYYRLRLECGLSGSRVSLAAPAWIGELSASISADDEYAWETFTAAVTQYDRARQAIRKNFQHAWGPYTEQSYHGLTVPDCPPVYLVPGLAELHAQARQAAVAPEAPLLAYVLDVFVDNE